MVLDDFVSTHMCKHGQPIPARLQAALALLEKLRDHPSLQLFDHKKPNSSGLDSHETFGNLAHDRFSLERINKNHGRRSCDVGGWGQLLLDLLRDQGFDSASPIEREGMIQATQECFVGIIRGILDADPLTLRIKGRSAEAVVREALRLAGNKNKAGDVAQYLVGAKLQLRLGREVPVVSANKGDRKSWSDTAARTGDFEIGDATIEVAMGLPDEKHISQVAEALENSDLQVWLLTRHDRVETWQHELATSEGIDMKRVVVASVESFVGQNMTEMGGFSSKGTASHLKQLFELYNNRWIAAVGTPGIRIVVK
jgi:hypothetical protein